MGAPDVLARVAAAGISLKPLPDGRILAGPSSRLTDELRALIRAHRAELTAALDATTHPPLPDAPCDELSRLVRQFATCSGFTEKDTDEALRVALEHPHNALAFYRSEISRLGLDTLPDPAAEARRQKVLEMLAAHPEARYAVLSDTRADPEAVLLTMAIRGLATFELRIPREKYDGMLLLELIERHGGTIH